MRILMLRSAHVQAAKVLPPPGGDLKNCQDVWTLLFDGLCRRLDAEGLIWRWGPPTQGTYRPGLREIWGRDSSEAAAFAPDVIINRGGYGAYLPALRLARPKFKGYYGAGCRWLPRDKVAYDVIWVDTPGQRQEVMRRWPNKDVRHLIKPAAETVFFPRAADKIYDAAVICHMAREKKGLPWLAANLPAGLSVLRVGQPDEWFFRAAQEGRLTVTFTGLVDRRQVAERLSQCRCSIVADDGQWDANPRILAESLACGVPVVVRACVRTDFSRYVPAEAGAVFHENRKDLAAALRMVLAGELGTAPRNIYAKNCSMGVAVEDLAGPILEKLNAA